MGISALGRKVAFKAPEFCSTPTSCVHCRHEDLTAPARLAPARNGALTSFLPYGNCQERYTTNDAEADNPTEASARANRANARHQRNQSARRCLPTAEPCCIQPLVEARRQTECIGAAGGSGSAASEGVGEGVGRLTFYDTVSSLESLERMFEYFRWPPWVWESHLYHNNQDELLTAI